MLYFSCKAKIIVKTGVEGNVSTIIEEATVEIKTILNDSKLYQLFILKYGHPSTTGPTPRRRLAYGYYPADDIYEGVVHELLTIDTKWLDVGGGRFIFPNNDSLSKILAEKCKRLVSVDPSVNILENPYAHEKNMCMIEDFHTKDKFDLVTFRMVAEHIKNPVDVLLRLKYLVSSNGVVVIYTPNKFCATSMLAYFVTDSLKFKVKKFFFGGEKKDTFPVVNKMNTRKQLEKLLTDHGFKEDMFFYLDDLSIFNRFQTLNLIEILVWKIFKALGFIYPENNLLGVYRRQKAT